MNKKNIFKEFYSLILPEKKNIKHIYFLAILQGIFYLMIPLGIQAIITYTMAGQISASLILLGLLTVVAVLFTGIFQLWQMRIDETIQQSILINVAVRFAEKLSILNPNLYLKSYIPAKINQFLEIITLQKGLSKILLEVSFAVISIVFGLIILTGYSPFFLIFTAIISLAFFILVKSYGTQSLETNINSSTAKYQFLDWLQKIYSGIKHNNPEFTNDYIVEQTDQSLGNYLQEKNKFYILIDKQYRIILWFKVAFIAILLFSGIWMVQSGVLNIGQFVASEIVIILVINAVEKLVLSLKIIYDVLTAVTKIFQILELEEGELAITHEVKEEYKIIFQDLDKVKYDHPYTKKTFQVLYAIGLILTITLFLPWTQNLSAEGKVTTLNPSLRPQSITSRISGRIENWFVNEGDYVTKGDTIVYISEIKDDYFDPRLIDRTQSQLQSKESSIRSYEEKIHSIDDQINAINNALKLKLQQTENKVLQSRAKLNTDSADYIAASNNYKIAEDQFKRYEELYSKGIISKTDYENRKGKLQESLAKKVSSENKWTNAKSDLLNVSIELNSIEQEYNEKLMKAESEKFSAMSALYDAEASLTKMQNQLSNYNIRIGMYYVTAPQSGYITLSHSQGVGEIVKEGAPLVSIVPDNNTYSVEFYIEPMDLPLIQKGEDVQLTFDGWPAFVFSGWPGVSFGTYHATVVAIDRVISENGKFRVLAKQGNTPWPSAIQQGSGVKALVMLNNVPVAYEIWRKVNGFPPEFYHTKNKKHSTKKDDSKKK